MDFLVVDPEPINQALQDLYQQTQQLHQRLSTDLAVALDRYYVFSPSDRFWSVVIGPCLRSFCDNIVLRWAFLNQARNQFDITESYTIIDDSDLSIHPRNFSEYRDLLKSQTWNQYVYSKMWILMKNSHLSSHPVNQGHEIKSLPRELLMKGTTVSRKRVILSDTYLPRLSQTKLTALMGSRPTRVRRVAAPTVTFDPEARSRLHFDEPSADLLHTIAREIVRDQIPTAYFEGLPELLQSASRLRLPDTPKLIFTSNRHLYDDVFNSWVAQATERGSTYVIGQHGGVYGLSRFPSYAELHEATVSDANITWGWGNSKKQVAGICLTTVGRKYRPAVKATHMLIVCDHLWAHPRSLFFDISEQAGFLEYVTRCTTGLPTRIRENVLIRLNHAHAETGSSQLEWWKTHAPTIAIDNGLSDIRKVIRKSRLVVTTYNGTTFLETLNLNIPTIITWSSSYVQLRSESLPYFQRLKEVGIFHDNEQSFIDHVTRNWTDIESWWASDDVQSARLMFCNQYSRIHSHPLSFLRRTLKTVIDIEEHRP